MKLAIDCPNDGTHALRISDDKSHLELLMEYDHQLEYYSVAIRNGAEGEVEPCDPIRRREGEDDEVYFDRASSLATRIYLNRVDQEIEQQSRYQRMQPKLARIRDKTTHIDLTLAHWDNDTPTEEELGILDEILSQLTRLDDRLTEVS